MVDQAKNFMIGLFVVAAISIIVFILLFLHPSVGNEERVLRVRFSNIDKVSIGTRVTFAGKPVGEVVAIEEVRDIEENRIGRNGHVYVYELTLRVDSGVNVFNSDEISARTSGLLGEKSIAITPLPAPKDQPLKVVNDEVIYADETATVEETFKDFRQLADKFEETLVSLTDSIREIERQKLWEKIAQTAQNLSEITSSLNQPGAWSEVTTNIRDLSNKVVKTWKTVDMAAKSFNQATSNVRDMTADGKIIMGDVKAAKGTVGKLIMRDDLYLKASALLSKGDTVMNDINHYGLLFNSDKGWQRLRSRRLNMLAKLSTPQEFRNYFNDELDQIQTSVERVAMVLDRTQNVCPPQFLACDRDFTKVFVELLTRIKELEESVNMYNEQLADETATITEINCVPCP